ncbi:MAG: amino acid ABC transporter permease [Rhodospirillales bacterium]|nr:MAG: amino acid ABC transporter permease [Rhodospirillales bacterium]
MMFAPYGLVYMRLGTLLPSRDDNAFIGFAIRAAVIVVAGAAGYWLGRAAVGAAEAGALGWMAAFLAFGLVTLNRATVKAWITFLLIFIYPFIAYFLWVGDGFGLQYVETARWGGLFLTLVVAGTGIAASLPIGIIFALGRRSDMPAIRSVSIAFIELWRGVPLITVLFMSSVMLPLFLPEGVNFDKLLRALIGVALFSAAYMAEVVRGGLQAIPKGQYEAAAAMGLGYWKMMRLVILPQALKLVIPGIVNTFIGLFKDTTLVLIIGLFDLLGIVQAATTDPKWLGMAVEGYVFTAFVFWIFCFGMSRYSMYIERKLHTGHAR